MDIAVGNGERIVKSWEYAKTKGGVKSSATLTVTDKRVISLVSSKNATARDDIPVDAITGISTNYNSNFSLLFILLGVICCITIILFPIGLNLIRKGTGTSLHVYLNVALPDNNFISTSSIRKRRKVKKVKIKVDRHCAKEIAEELSTIIFTELEK